MIPADQAVSTNLGLLNLDLFAFPTLYAAEVFREIYSLEIRNGIGRVQLRLQLRKPDTRQSSPSLIYIDAANYIHSRSLPEEPSQKWPRIKRYVSNQNINYRSRAATLSL